MAHPISLDCSKQVREGKWCNGGCEHTLSEGQVRSGWLPQRPGQRGKGKSVGLLCSPPPHPIPHSPVQTC